MKPSVRPLFVGVAVAFFFTLTLAALAQEKPAPATPETPPVVATPTPPSAVAPAVESAPAPATERALRRIDGPVEEPAPDSPAAPTKAKKTRAPQTKERAEALTQRAAERAERAEARTGEAIVNVFADSVLEKDKKADAVVAVFGNATAEGAVVDAVVAVFGNTRVTGPVGAAVVSVFGNSYVNSHVTEGVVVVFGDLELGPDARIDGQVVCVGGNVTRDAAAVTKAGVKAIISTKVAWLRAWLHECFLKARPLAFGPNLGWAWGIAAACLALYTLAALLFRTGAEKCLTTLETRPGFSVLAALLATLITPVLTVLLVMTGVGIIAVPFIGAGMLCATLFGKVVILAWLGRRITRYFGDGPLGHIAFAVMVGGVIVMALYTVPVLGFLVFKLIGWIGLGAVVYTIVLGMKREKRPTPPAAPPRLFRPVVMGSAAAPMPVATAPVVAGETAAMSSGFGGAAVTEAVPPVSAGAAMGAGAGETGAVPPVSAPPVIPPSYAPPPPVSVTISAATLPRAGFWIRIAALGLDAVLIGVVIGFASDLLPRFLKFDHGPGGVLLALALYGAAMWKTKGTTIGGIVCGLKVVRLDDREIDWPTAVVRALSCFLSLFVAGLGFLWVVFDPEKQSWHDKIAGTTVVRLPKGVSLL
jgi:uncharacterized RDD family membrane protein YckC